MDDGPPPRKQLRLLVKGRDKIGKLFRGRRNEKTEGDKNQPSADDGSETEDEVPILSRIKDTVAPPTPRLRLKLNVDAHVSDDSAARSSATERQTAHNTNGKQNAGHNADNHSSKGDTPGSKALDSSADGTNRDDEPYAGFSVTNSTSQHPASAVQRLCSRNGQGSVLQSHAPLNNEGLTTLHKINSQPSHMLVRNAVEVEKHESRTSIVMSSPAGKGTETQNLKFRKKSHSTSDFIQCRPSKDTNSQSRRDRASEKSPTQIRAAQAQSTSTKRLFDGFKLSQDSSGQVQRLDVASVVDDISRFVRPQIPDPQQAPPIYRSVYHKPSVSRHLLERSIPDGVEIRQFIEDVEAGVHPPRKNENGDIPALVHDARTERVPLGARFGGLPDTRTTMFVPGRPIMQSISQSPQVSKYQQARFAMIPDNLYTEPNRLAKAYTYPTKRGLKRKRPVDTTLPPPSFIHQHRSSPAFNIFSNGILLYPELCLMLAAQLPVQTLINLYSVSKDFHVIINQRITTVILNQTTLKAPAAARCYPWRSYAHLCQPDPAHNAGTVSINMHLKSGTAGSTVNIASPPPPNHESTAFSGSHFLRSKQDPTIHPSASKRRVPTFRWLSMALHREKTIHEIYYLFAARGVPLPGDPTNISRNSFCLSLHKLWFAFDIPDNARRVAYFKSHILISPHDLSNIIVFIIKLDMLCNDPAAGEKRDAVRKLLMSSVNGLDTLRQFLKREIWTNELELLRAWTRYGFQLDRENSNEPPRWGAWVPLGLSEADHAASNSVFGIPRDEVGLLKKEFWGKFDYKKDVKSRTSCPIGRKTTFLMRPDQIVVREAIRRRMKMGRQIFKAVTCGYLDAKTLEAVPPRDLNGGRSRVLEGEGEYRFDDLVGGVRALKVADGGDPLLDLGDTSEGSALTVRHVGARKSQIDRRREEKDRLEAYKQGWKDDVAKEDARRACRGFTYVDG